MAQKYGNTEIESCTNQTPDGSIQRVKLVDGADISIHRDILEKVTSGTTFSFGKLPFETEFDRKRKERETHA